jgi:hypothetical protein
MEVEESVGAFGWQRWNTTASSTRNLRIRGIKKFGLPSETSSASCLELRWLP